MTLGMLEGYVRSEVDNLHLRVDENEQVMRHLADISESLRRQITVVWNAIDEIRADVVYIKQNFATKADLEQFATKTDLEQFVTKADLKRFATKKDLEHFATKQDLVCLEKRIERRIEQLFKSYLAPQ